MNRKPLIALSLLTILLTNCRQIRELQSFAKCDFRINTVKNTTLAGVDVQNVRSFDDLNLAQGIKITSAYAQGSVPLNLVVNVDVKNPNASNAAMNRMEWIMLIDDREIVDGVVNDRVEIAPNGVSTLPIRISTDLKKVLDSMPREEAINMGFGLTGSGDKPTRITLKVKPSILVGGTAVNYPGYIKINSEFN